MLDLKKIFDLDEIDDWSTRAGDSRPARKAVTVGDLSAYWREYYEERAAIREYEGGQAREHAEAEALRETIAAMTKRRI